MGVSTQTIAKTGETIYYSDGSKVSKSVYESAKERESTVQRYQSPSGKRVSVGRESIGGKEVAVVVGSPEAIEEVAPSRKKSSVQKYVTPYGRSVSVGRETIGGRDVEIAVGSPKAISEVTVSRYPSYGVYDVVRQQTRIASPIESAVVQQQLERGKMSYAVPQKERSISESLRDPSTQRIYFQTTRKGVEPVAVYSTQPIIKERSVYGVAPEKSFWGKIKASQLGVLGSEFKAGFGFRPSPSFAMSGSEQLETAFSGRLSSTGERLSMFEAGSRRLAFIGGTTTGIVASSVFFWEGVGAKAAIATYHSPKVWSVVEKTGKILGSPAGKYVQRSSLVLYGGFKSVDVIVAGKTEGLSGVGREGLKISRTFSGIGGLSKGFKEGSIEAIKSTYYLAKGESRAATIIKDKTMFETGLATRGKIYEFSGSKLRRTFTFEDIAKVSGSTKELGRSVIPFRPPLAQFKETKTVTVTSEINAYIKGRTGISFKGKPFADYTSASDVRVLQKTKSAMLLKFQVNERIIESGIGGSRFKFIESKNVFGDPFRFKVLSQDKIYGIGKSNFNIVKYGDIVKVKGKVRTFDDKVTTKFDFKEQIVNLGESKGFVDLNKEFGLTTKAITKQVSQNVVGKIVPVKSQESVKAIVAIPKQQKQTQSFIVQPKSQLKSPIKTVQESFYSGKLFIPPDLKQEFKQQYNIKSVSDSLISKTQREKVRSRQRSRLDVVAGQRFAVDSMVDKKSQLVPLSDVKSRQRVIQDQFQGEAQAFLPKTRVDQRVAQRQEAALRQVQIFDDPVSVVKGFGFGRPVPSVNINPFAFNLPDFSGDTKKVKGGMGKLSFDTKYTPTLEAELFNIKGEKPSKFEVQSGLTVRPLL